METLGRNLVLLGLALAIVGALLWLLGRSGGGWLPGDIVIERKAVRFYFPLATCLVVSLLVTLIVWLIRR